MTKIIPDVSSNKLAIDWIVQQPKSDHQEALRQLKGNRSADVSFNPIPELLIARRNVPHSLGLRLLEIEKTFPISTEFMTYASRLGILKKQEINHNTKVNAVTQILAVIRTYYQISHFREIDLTIWRDFAEQVKKPDTNFQEGLSTVHINAIRILAKALSGFFETKRYSYLIAKHRSARDYSHNGRHIAQQFENWEQYYNEWISGVMVKSIKDRKASFNKLRGYLASFEDASEPLAFLSRERSYSFWQYLSNKKYRDKRATALQMNDFVNWIIEHYLTETDDSGDATIAYPILSAKEINYVLDWKNTNVARPSESVKHAMPTKWLLLCKEILTENNYAWPKSLPYEYVEIYNSEIKSYEQVWSPISTCVYLIMCELPLRRIQVKSLDSGEGDTERYDASTKEWVANTSTHAKYWSIRNEGQPERGFIRKIITQGQQSVGFYINTNKTQDRSTAFSDMSGYVIPWNNADLINIYDYTRAWQEKYNPVEYPQKYKDIPNRVFSTESSELVKNLIPDRFYLFRSRLHAEFGAPISDAHLHRFWLALMEELERRLQKQGDDVQIITKRSKHNAPQIAIFTPHGLRVTGLTAFVEAGVPIEVLSKIVAGHASILMTLYYVKFNPAHISKVLTEAQKKIEDSAQANFSTYMKNALWEDANKYSVFNDQITIKTIYDTQDTALWESNQIGICPNASTRCNEGGELIRKDGKKDIYGEVPGGKGNCVRCRFFLTGKPWLLPLWLHTNKLLADSRKMSLSVEKARNELEGLYAARKKIVKENGSAFIPSDLTSNIKAAEGQLDRKTAELDQTLCDAHAAYRLTEGLRKLPDFGDESNNLPALLDEDAGETEFVEQHRFRQQNLLVQASRLYQHIHDDDLERERNQFIDKVMFQAGLTPLTLTTLSEDEVKSAADALSTYLASQLTDAEMDMLEKGAVSLDELGLKTGANKLVSTLSSSAGQLEEYEQVE